MENQDPALKQIPNDFHARTSQEIAIVALRSLIPVSMNRDWSDCVEIDAWNAARNSNGQIQVLSGKIDSNAAAALWAMYKLAGGWWAWNAWPGERDDPIFIPSAIWESHVASLRA